MDCSGWTFQFANFPHCTEIIAKSKWFRSTLLAFLLLSDHQHVQWLIMLSRIRYPSSVGSGICTAISAGVAAISFLKLRRCALLYSARQFQARLMNWLHRQTNAASRRCGIFVFLFDPFQKKSSSCESILRATQRHIRAYRECGSGQRITRAQTAAYPATRCFLECAFYSHVISSFTDLRVPGTFSSLYAKCAPHRWHRD